MFSFVTDEQRVEQFVRRFVPGKSLEGFRALGLERDGEIVGGVIYEGFNGSNVFCHIAGEGHYWLTKQFLREMFRYPFETLNAKRITAYIDPENERSCEFVMKLGFGVEARLEEASPSGGDMLIFTMKKGWCRYV